MKHTVLVVEDERELRELIREALELEGYDVIAAADGREALEALSALSEGGAPSMVLLDLLMPGMNGWEFFDEFRARPGLSTIPVVIHTSAANDAPKGAAMVVQKPLKLERLLEVVSELCSVERSA